MHTLYGKQNYTKKYVEIYEKGTEQGLLIHI